MYNKVSTYDGPLKMMATGKGSSSGSKGMSISKAPCTCSCCNGSTSPITQRVKGY
jgi:hypothetical protein